ncbi:MAG: allantoinase AllB [Chloroflexi bacterium]|nr:MAG: allantoinase AllB [Chloroflexota bacterium]
MSELDLIVRGGRVVTGGHVTIADIGVAEGVITALGPNLAAVADHEVDATGMHVFPGGVDSHVHFNDPGRTEWETIAAGSAALAAGGYTCFVDMPLNNLPVTTTAKAFDLKLDAAQRTSILDFGLWGGLVPGNLGHLEELAARGVIGFKAFMCPSGIDEFPACDETVLREGMKRIGDLDSILLVHAEDPAALHPPGGTGWRDYVKSRPPDAEWMAIYQAIALAAETGCRLHIVHVSTKHGIELVDEAHRHGIDVSAETCPHYLLYSSGDLDRLGGVGKCSPPFRTNDDRDGLWRQLADGVLQMIVSDHSPSTLELKQGADFFKLWGGISGCQSTRQLVLWQAQALSIGPATIAAATATNIARRFGLARKGEVAVGFDADLWLADLSVDGIVRREDLLYRNQFSAHEGMPIHGRTAMTMVRGHTAVKDGRVDRTSRGRLIKPER